MMGFTRRNVGVEATAPDGDEHKRMASGSLINASLVAGQNPHVVESSGLEIAPFAAEQDAHNVVTSSLGNATSSAGHDLGSLRTAQSQRIRQPSLPQATTTTPSIAIAERITVTWSMNFRAFAGQVDAVIKANSAAQVIPSAEAIAAEVLKQHKDSATQQHGTGVFREIWREHRNEAGMVREAGLAYKETDDNGREIYCPVCLTYCEIK
jgi:hypothetical protein